MPKAKRICKVCGKTYEYCHTIRQANGIFRWQDVACSPECGATYLAQIRLSRSKAEPTDEQDETVPEVQEPEELEDDDWTDEESNDESEEILIEK